jgi:hypothetical protein
VSETYLDYDMEIDNSVSKKININQLFEEYSSLNRRTKILCTMGPANDDVEVLGKMIDAGMNVARFNFSHGTIESNQKKLDLLKQAIT